MTDSSADVAITASSGGSLVGRFTGNDGGMQRSFATGTLDLTDPSTYSGAERLVGAW